LLIKLSNLFMDIEITNSRKIVDTRNRIIHGYDSVSDEIVWGIVINHLPILQKEVQVLSGEYFVPKSERGTDFP